MTDRDLVTRIARAAGGKAGYKQLVRELGLGGGRERRLLLEQLERLTARGELAKIDREHWGIPRAATGTRDNLVAGRLDLHRDGYGFVRPNPNQSTRIDEDIFIPPTEINGAMQGDQVLVELEPPRADGRRSGRIGSSTRADSDRVRRASRTRRNRTPRRSFGTVFSSCSSTRPR